MCTRPAEEMSGGFQGGARADGAGAEVPGPSGGPVASAPFRTPWGDGRVTVHGADLVEVDLPPCSAPVRSGDRPGGAEAADAPAPRTAEALARWVRELEAYFVGDKLSWTPEEVGVGRIAGGAFAQAVYETLLSVPPGVTVSYGALAAMAGHPRAARAVGTAMATNPIPIVVPCHRVIKADGSLGRYGSEPAWKERLLAHERKYGDAEGRMNGR